MGKTSLSSIMFMLLIGLFAFTTSFQVYTSFMADNGGSYDSKYDVFYDEMGNAYYNATVQAKSTSGNVQTNLISTISNVAFGTVNVFIIGLTSIGSLFGMVPILNGVIESLTQLFPQFRPLLGLLTVIIGFYIAMRFIKSARGSSIDV